MVLDVNVLVRLVVPGEYREHAMALWNQVMVHSVPCAVPAFCSTEVISSIRQMGRGGLLTTEEEALAASDFVARIRPVLISIDSPALTLAGWELAHDLDERHTYDSVYLAVARAFAMEFWTADRQLLRRLDVRFPEARFLGDYPLPPASA